MRRDQGAAVQLDRVRAAGAVPGRPQRGLPQVSPRQTQSQVLSIAPLVVYTVIIGYCDKSLNVILLIYKCAVKCYIDILAYCDTLAIPKECHNIRISMH